MSKGSKEKYTDKQKRQAHHIEESEKKRGRSKKEAEKIAYATVNKKDGGGKKGGSGEASKVPRSPRKKGEPNKDKRSA